MAKKQAQTELEVVSCFDGELDAVEVFANLIARQCQGINLSTQIAEPAPDVYNEAEVRQHHASSGLCGSMI